MAYESVRRDQAIEVDQDRWKALGRAREVEKSRRLRVCPKAGHRRLNVTGLFSSGAGLPIKELKRSWMLTPKLSWTGPRGR